MRMLLPIAGMFVCALVGCVAMRTGDSLGVTFSVFAFFSWFVMLLTIEEK